MEKSKAWLRDNLILLDDPHIAKAFRALIRFLKFDVLYPTLNFFLSALEWCFGYGPWSHDSLTLWTRLTRRRNATHR
jgi:hypothetical protein